MYRRTGYSLVGMCLLSILTALLIQSCDLFNEDAPPQNEALKIGQKEFYTLPNSSAVIDLKTVISSFENVNVAIASQPVQGSLQKLSGTLFKYQPSAAFSSGKDYFTLAFTFGNGLVKKDSIAIVVDQDTTLFPCQLYAVGDAASTRPETEVIIPVLSNDRLCGIDRADLELSVFQNPQHGNAVVTNDSIHYSPDTGFKGTDYFVYKLSVTGDSTESYGYVHLTVSDDTCTVAAADDHFSFEQPAGRSSLSFWFYVTSNDQMCDSTAIELSIVEQPALGTATVLANHEIMYSKHTAFTESYTDSLKYRICLDGTCDDAFVSLYFAYDTCALHANDDILYLNDSTAIGSVNISLLDNDIICGSSPEIVVVDGPRHGTITKFPDRLAYLPDSGIVMSDSIRYKLCSSSCSSEAYIYMVPE